MENTEEYTPLIVYENDKVYAWINFHDGKVFKIYIEPDIFEQVINYNYTDNKTTIKSIKDIVSEFDEIQALDPDHVLFYTVPEAGITSTVCYDGSILCIKKWIYDVYCVNR